MFKEIFQGIITLGDDIFIMSGRIKNKYFYRFSKEIASNIKLEAEIMKPLLKNEHIIRYL